jgi:hypothetical protein
MFVDSVLWDWTHEPCFNLHIRVPPPAAPKRKEVVILDDSDDEGEPAADSPQALHLLKVIRFINTRICFCNL